MHPNLALFVIGLFIGVNAWLYWVEPWFGVAFSILFLIGALRVKFRLVSAFIFGLFLGFS